MRVGRWGTVLIAGVLLVAGCGDGGAADDTAESSGDTTDAQTDSEPSEPADNSESEAPEPTPQRAAISVIRSSLPANISRPVSAPMTWQT
jgi:hypothetical protein